MEDALKNQILDNLTKAQNIQIVSAETTGLDGLAAGLALLLSLLKLQKNVSIIAKSPSVGDAQSLYGVDNIGKKKGKSNFVIVVDNAVQTVDKVTHSLEGEKLKIVVHPFGSTSGVAREQISFEESTQSPDLVLALGIDSVDQLRSEITHEQNLDPNVFIIAVGSQKSQQKFAQIYINYGLPSLSENVSLMIQDLALPVDEDIAFNLYSGIKNASDNFSPSSTSQATLEIASWLIKFGAGKASMAGRPTSQAQPRGEPQPQIDQGTHQRLQTFPEPQFYSDEILNTPLENVEQEDQKDWLKPPKIYKGSKSFGGENKN